MTSERELERIDRRHNIFMVLLIAMVAGVLAAFVILGHTFTERNYVKKYRLEYTARTQGAGGEYTLEEPRTIEAESDLAAREKLVETIITEGKEIGACTVVGTVDE